MRIATFAMIKIANINSRVFFNMVQGRRSQLLDVAFFKNAIINVGGLYIESVTVAECLDRIDLFSDDDDGLDANPDYDDWGSEEQDAASF